jgi:predicted transcriptional regulator
MTSVRPLLASPEDDDVAEREALRAAVERGRADVAGRVVPHERVREWLLDMAAGGDAPLPEPDKGR